MLNSLDSGVEEMAAVDDLIARVAWRKDRDLAQQTAVSQAATVLDSVRPGWARKVNPDALDLNSSYACVLGQVFAEDCRLARVYGATTPYQLGCLVLGEFGGALVVNAAVFALNSCLPQWREEIQRRVA